MADRKRSGKAPANETKPQKFQRLANMRVNRALRAIRGIGALGGTAYESTADQRKAIKTALQSSMDSSLAQLETGKSAASEFKI